MSLFWQKIDFRKRFWTQIILLGLFLLFLIGSSCLFIDRIQSMSQKVEVNKLSLESGQSENEKIAQLRQEHKEAESYFSQVDSFVLTGEEVVNVLSEIETMAGQTGNVIRINMIEEKQIDEQTQSLKYQVSLGGNIKSFLAYAEKFEKLPVFLVMQKVDISTPSGDSAEGAMFHQISMFLEKGERQTF